MLVLFDVDATLLLTHGAGLRAMKRAGRSLYGGEFSLDGVEFAGRLDSLIWQDLARRNAVPNAGEELPQFLDKYFLELKEGFQGGDVSQPLPGVLSLIDALQDQEGVILGVLTGNFECSGRLKIAQAGIDPGAFQVCTWALDGEQRHDLPPVAMRRCKELTGEEIRPSEVVIVGDTPYDVGCALHNGCRALGVATGRFGEQQLADAGAHRVMSDLSQTRAVVATLLDGVSSGPIHSNR